MFNTYCRAFISFASGCQGKQNVTDIGWIVIVIAVLLTLPLGDKEFAINFKTIVTWIAALAILITLLFELMYQLVEISMAH